MQRQRQIQRQRQDKYKSRKSFLVGKPLHCEMDPGSKLNPLVSAQRQEHHCYVVIIIIHFEYNVISKSTIGSVMLYTYCKTTLLCTSINLYLKSYPSLNCFRYSFYKFSKINIYRLMAYSLSIPNTPEVQILKQLSYVLPNLATNRQLHFK